MTFIAGLKDALIAQLNAALPTEYTLEARYRNVAEVDAGERPYGMVFGATTASEQLQMQQERQVITLTVILVRRGGEETEMEQDVEAAMVWLRNNPRIYGTVYNAWYSETEVDPTGEAHTVGRLLFTCERVVD